MEDTAWHENDEVRNGQYISCYLSSRVKINQDYYLFP